MDTHVGSVMKNSATRGEVTIGVIGGEDVVQRVMTIAREQGSRTWRLTASVYADETEAVRLATRLAPRVDVCLFGGPLPHDVAVSHGDLPVPATYIPVGGSALYATLLRAVVGDVLDPERVTIDSVSVSEVEAAYGEVGLAPSRISVLPYDNPESARGFLEFHQSAFEDGSSSGAITTVPSIAAALGEAGVPTLTMRATVVMLRNALHTAALMGSGFRLEESRIVTMIVRVPAKLVPVHASPSNYWYQELKLSLQRELLREARSMDAAVLPRDEQSFLVITTMGSLTAATDELTVAPFLGRVAESLNVDVELGIGLGRSTREAESNAQTAVDKAASSRQAAATHAFLVGPHETIVELPARRRSTTPKPAPPAHDRKAVEALRTLAAKLADEHDSERVVDAEQVAQMLDVTLRTARRTLQLLVDEGLAWPMPPARSSKIGRPPRPYQLLVEKLPNQP
jgi:hypothetical protein